MLELIRGTNRVEALNGRTRGPGILVASLASEVEIAIEREIAVSVSPANQKRLA